MAPGGSLSITKRRSTQPPDRAAATASATTPVKLGSLRLMVCARLQIVRLGKGRWYSRWPRGGQVEAILSPLSPCGRGENDAGPWPYARQDGRGGLRGVRAC